jgi:molybdate transport system ATP-binding protein
LNEDTLDKGIAYVCFEQQRALIERDKKLDDSEFRPDAADPGTTVKSAIAGSGELDESALAWIHRLKIEHILSRGIRFISTGEARKTLLIQAIQSKPGLLILDTPTDGLDKESQATLQEAIEALLLGDNSVVLLYRDIQNLPQAITHVLVLDEGRIASQGTKADVLADPTVQALFADHKLDLSNLPLKPTLATRPETTLDLRNVNLSYGDTCILQSVYWRMRSDQNTLLAGPNGSGKTTLLSLITGDNPKAYGQDISVFGFKRGSGESIWELKKYFGVVDSASHLNFPPRQRTLNVVISGFFDSFGLYQMPSDAQKREAKAWLQALGLAALIESEFDTLSFGQQRLVLLARAMIKQPKLLILDEPTLGLDRIHTKWLLDAVDHIVKQSETQVIFVSHSVGEYPMCINQYLEFKPTETGYELLSRE